MEDSKAGEMKKYKESIMKENDKIQIIKENLFMEVEDMHAKAAVVYLRFTDLTNKYEDLDKQNTLHMEEIERLKKLLKNTEFAKESTQEKLEKTECMLSEYMDLYNTQVEIEKKLEKQCSEMDKTIRKLNRENKQKDSKLKEMAELKERLRVNEQRLEEFQDANNKTYADLGCQTVDMKSVTVETQTEMTLNKIFSLERNLTVAQQEKTKYLQVVKSYKVHGYTPMSGSKSPSLRPEDEDVSTPLLRDLHSFDLQEGEEGKADFSGKQTQAEKQVKREQDFKKKIHEDKKKTKDVNAYESLLEYKKRKIGEEKEDNQQEDRLASPLKEVDPLDVQGNEEFKEQPQTPTRQTIELTTNKDRSFKAKIEPEAGRQNSQNRNLFTNAMVNESAEDSYSKDEDEILGKPHINTGRFL